MLFIMRLHSFVEFFLSGKLTKASLIDFFNALAFRFKNKDGGSRKHIRRTTAVLLTCGLTSRNFS